MAKHTPGNWRPYVTRGSSWAVADSAGRNIVRFNKRLGGHGTTYWFEEDEANAHLIASAPYMLEVLKEVAAAPLRMSTDTLNNIQTAIARADIAT